MAKHGRPRLRDVRHIYRLLGECTEMGSDSMAWRSHLLEGISGIIGARVGLYMHIHNPLSEQESVDASIASGFMDSQHIALWEHYQQEQAYRDDPFHTSYFQDHRQPLRTRDLAGVVNMREWKKSWHYNEYIRACGLGDRITSSLRVAADTEAPLQTLVLHRDAADGEFSPDAKYLVRLAHHELSGLLGKQLALPTSRMDTGSLPPRMAQVLDALLKGEPEKRIADSLGLSPHTVNRHVQRIYRHFSVNSRAKLIALLSGENHK